MNSIENHIPSLGGGSGDAHGAIAAVDALHLNQRALLVRLVAKADKAISAGLAGHRVRHDLGGLARGEARLEQRNQNELVDLRAEVADKDTKLRAAIIPFRELAKFIVGNSRGSYRRSTKPPPEAQFSLKTRVELGTGVPFRLRAF